MIRYVARRIIAVLPVLFGVSVAVFLMIRLVPGDVVTVVLGTEGTATPERTAELRRLFGLDRPLYVQYVDWAGRLIVGDFGKSLRTSRPILPDVLARLPVTIHLMATAMAISLLVAVPLGIISAVRRYTAVDSAVRMAGLIGLSIPNFWLATMLVLFVSLFWRILPTSGYVPFDQDPIGSFRSILLPALSLGAANMAILMRMTRSSMLEVLRQEYVTTARAKGLHERAVIVRHALPNALIPIVTVAGIQVGHLLSGAIIIEQIFALPGLGRLVLFAVFNRDWPLIQGLVFFIAVLTIGLNFLVDLSYAWLDPRIGDA